MGRGSKNLSKGNRKLALMHESERLHYRMYKAGRTWLFAGIATFSLGAVLLGTPTQASAATQADPTTEQSAATTANDQAASDTTADQEAATATKVVQPSDYKPATSTTPATGDIDNPANYNDDKGAVQAGKAGDVLTSGPTKLDTSQTEGKVDVPEGATTEPDTSGALIKGSMFGDGLKTSAENSATAGLGGDTQSADSGTIAGDAIQGANAATNRTKGEYGDPYYTGVAQVPDGSFGDGSISAPGDHTASLNDNLDMKISSGDLSSDKDKTDQAKTIDIMNDQGAVSSDSDNLQQRATTIYVDGVTKDWVNVSALGSGQQGATIGVPDAIKSSLLVGTLQVVQQNAVGIVLKNKDTGEYFQIVNSDYGNSDANGGNNHPEYAVGTDIDGKAIYTAVMNGQIVEDVVGAVTNGISGISGIGGDIGKFLIGDIQRNDDGTPKLDEFGHIQGKSLIPEEITDTVSSIVADPTNLGNLAKIPGAATSIGKLLTDGTLSLDNIKTFGVSGIVATLVDLLKMVGVDTTDFQQAYGIQIGQINDQIDDLNKFGDQLMADGVKVTALEDANISTQDGKTVISVNSDGQVETASAILNMVKSYITGWVTQISKSLDAVFAGDQPVIAPDANDPMHAFDTKKPIDVLINDINHSSIGSGLIGSAITGIVKSLFGLGHDLNTKVITPGINGITDWVSNGLGDAISPFISGSLGGIRQTVAVPVKFTDPKLVDMTTGQSAVPGQFVGLTFNTASKVFNDTETGATTIAYQNVDKTQLKQLLAAGTPAGSTIPQSATDYAHQVDNAVNASQYDVDKAVIGLGGHILDQRLAGNLTLSQNVTGTTAAKSVTDAAVATDAAKALNDALKAGTAASSVTVAPGTGVIANGLDSTGQSKGLDLSGLTADDFNIDTGKATLEDGVITVPFTYNSTSGTEGVAAALDKLSTDQNNKFVGPQYLLVDPSVDGTQVVGKILLTATDATPNTDETISYKVQAADDSGKAFKDLTTNPTTPSVSTPKVTVTIKDGTLDAVDAGEVTKDQDGQTVDLSLKGLPQTVTVAIDNGTTTTTTVYTVPTKDSETLKDGTTYLVKYTKGTSTDSTDTPTDNQGEVKYTIVAVGENPNSDGTPGAIIPLTDFNADQNTDLSGVPGSVITGNLKDSYKDADGNTWYKPANLSSYVVPKAGGTIQVLYTDKDTTGDVGQTGEPSWKIVDGKLVVDDGNGHTLTIDPNKVGSNGSGQPIIIIDSGNTNYYPNGGNGGADSNGSETPGNNGANGPITVVLPGQDGNNAGTKVTKNSDGSLTFTFPDGTTDTVQPGDATDHTDPNGGSFKVNPDGTITFTDGAGNSYTIDPNNKTNGTTQPGSKITNVVLPGKDGTDGKNGTDQTMMIEKTPNGDIVLHLPDGSTQTITSDKPGTLPDGSSVVINPDGTITITDPSGKTQTIDPDKGNTLPTGNNGSGQTTVTPVDTDGDGVADGFEITVGTNPSAVDTDGDGDTDLQEILNGTNPKDPSSNVKTLGNGNNGSASGPINIYINGGSVSTGGSNGTDGTNGSTAVQPIIVTIPGEKGADGKDAGTIVTKNSDGSLTFTFPDGTTQTVQPTDQTDHTTPNGTNFKVNPDGTITFTDGTGNSFTIDPNKEKGATVEPGSKTTVLVIPGQNDSNGENTPDQIVTVEKGKDGTLTLHFPDGTTKTVQPGDTGELPDGTKWVVTPEGLITFTTPDGKTYTADPDKGTTNNVTINNVGGGTTGNSADVDGDGIPDNLENILGTNPSNKDTDGDGDSDLQEMMNNTNPKDPNSNLKTIGNDNKGTDGTDGTNGTDGQNTVTPIVVSIPGKDGKDAGATVTKNPDGSVTFTFPDGSTQTVQPGDNKEKTNPAGGSFVVNPDGTITFTDPSGKTYTIDPNTDKGAGTTTAQPGSKTTVVVIPGQNGTDGTNTPDQVVTVEKGTDGTLTLHFPDGTTKVVHINDTDTLPGGGSYVVNPDGTITFTNPDGSTSTIDPSKGTTHNVTINTGTGNVGNAVDTDGDGIPDSFETKIGTNTAKTDSDGDGDTDFQEVLNHTNPLDPASNLKSLENGGKDGSTSTTTTTTTTTINNVPGQDSGVKATKNPDGSITFTFPDGSTQTVQPGDSTQPDANGGFFKVNQDGTITFTDGNGNSYTIDPNKGTTTNPIIVTIPGQDGGVKATKNPDGSITFTFPDGTTQTVQPGDATKPDGNGGSFKVNSDGTITITNPDGSNYTFDPNNGQDTPTQPGSKSTVIVLPGKDGATSVVTAEKTPNGDIILHLPDGSTQTVEPGKGGTLPDGTTYTYNPDGTFTFTTPDGKTVTINPDNGTSGLTTSTSTTTNTTNNGGTTNNTTNNYYGTNGPATTTITLPAGKDGVSHTITYTKNPDGTATITTPDGKTKTVQPGDTGTLPNGGTYTVLPDGSLSISNPEGTTTIINPGNGTNGSTTTNGNDVDTDGDGIPDSFETKVGTDINNIDTDGDGDTDLKEVLNGTNPLDPNSNFENPGNGGSDTNNGGSTGQPITINIPGQTGAPTVTKNSDGSLTFTFPDGSTQTVQPGDGKDHDNPAGGTFKVNPDGTITFTDGDGNSYTVDPNNKTNGTTQPGSKITNIVLPGKDGTDGKDGADQTVMIEKLPNGDVILHFPDGTTQTVQPGSEGKLPNGTTWIVNPNGTITFTTPDGNQSTFDPNKGETTPTNTNNGGGSTTNTIDTDGDGIPDNFEVTVGTNPKNGDTDGDGDTDLQEILNGTDPMNPNSNFKNPGNGGSSSTNTVQPIVITLPGQNGGINVTKNSDGSLTFTFPDGSKETVQPGDNSSKTNPAGGSFVVNPDGTITFTGEDGSTYTIDPSKIGGQPTAGDSKTTVIVIPGQPGKDGQPGANTIVTVEKTTDGSTIIHMPGGTTKEVKPGDTGELPNGTQYIVNEDGSITFTNPDGSTTTVDPKDGNQGNIFINPNGGDNQGTAKTTVVFVPGKDGNGGIIINVTKQPNGDIIITNPDGSHQTVQPGDTGELPNGATFKVNEDGTITITNPDGSHFTIDPNKGASSTVNNNGGDIYYITNNYGSDGSKGTTITLPGGDDGKGTTITYTKNPDGTYTLTTPNGSNTLQPGDKGTLPNGNTYVVTPDGSLNITDKDGKTIVVTPGNGGSIDGKDHDVIVNITVNGGDTTSTAINTPAGNYTVGKNSNGTYVITGPDGKPVDNIKPGTGGTLPKGGSYTTTDTQVVITQPDGHTLTINFPKGGSTTPDDNNTGNGGPATSIPDNGGPATTTPDTGNGTPTTGTGTPTTNATPEGGTATTTTNNNGGGETNISTGEGTVVQGDATGTDQGGVDGTTEATAGGSVVQGTSNGSNGEATVAEGANVNGANETSQAADKSALPQTDEKPVEGIAALGLLGGLVSLLGLAGAKKRRKEL
ncbi:KxYKxGKxW signal peptide domain-containing protein [Secundilactobacillus mixtipabuli]|uniref:T-complex protein 10 C-terminus n=1 Tax=Secundilactobacillus mixtipabuli TaxID=1435342 RepID=A0A1Z5IB22_9LACO|nr:KxYKxGKxW signal peptide domain-containing protein [Secundilactobacillus mixtipabuli]GAW98825.1 T-complex protein 10 C-terminus [Secundilactobacillus mixtipabuli]